MFSGGGGGSYFIFSVDQKKQKPNLGWSLLSKLKWPCVTLYVFMFQYLESPALPLAAAIPAGPSSAPLSRRGRFVFCFSLCKGIARKASGKGMFSGN